VSTTIIVRSLHVGLAAWKLLPTVGAVNARQAWREHITSLLESALIRNDAVLEQVSAAMATAIERGSDVYAFGAGHSLSLVSEMHRRAGSLKVDRPIWNAELTSHSGEEAAGKLESAERRGVAVIALTSVEHSTSVPPAGGLPRLLEIADYVLDNAGRLGDASLDLPGPALIHAAWAGAAEKLVAAGHVPEVWGSVNRAPFTPQH
jgi:uncharacterized phosphosugar-binding protein